MKSLVVTAADSGGERSGMERHRSRKPREILTILLPVRGLDTGRHVFHRHMLEYEDNHMMRPYEVVSED
jgi:FtsP/CotA-like multicopper oxidase with cupredoxin domain